MATRDEIPTDLALEIGDDLEPRKFVAAVREFFALTEELAQTAISEGRSNWRVQVREGSNIVALAFAGGADTNAINATIHRVLEGTRALVDGDFSAPILTEKAIQHAKKLSDITKDKEYVVPMNIWLSREPIRFGPEIGELIRQDESASYNDFGTLEGTLRAISDQSGSLEIRIHDPLWRRAIPCRVDNDQIDQAMAAFRKRVEVGGMIHYNRLGRPTSIRMENLEILPDDGDLPTAADIRGLLALDAGEDLLG